nr:molybdopterin cofactor-binding domain-containing protein [Pseudophaeobacter sp. EL27]
MNIGSEGLITIFSSSAEMGQGTWTSLPLVVAEEMDAEWADVRIAPSPAFGDEYGDPMFGNMVFTSASRAAAAYFDRLRRYGAQARQVLMRNAAIQLDVPVTELTTRPSQVCHEASGRCLSYAEIAQSSEMPADLPSLESVALKDPKDFRLIGKTVPRYDPPCKMNGSTKFSIDVSLPGMLYAAVTRAPIDGTTVESVDHLEARKSPGVVEVLTGDGVVAVVARQYHQALAARKKLSIQWSDAGAAHNHASATAIQRNVDTARDLERQGIPWDTHGDALAGIASAGEVIEREYSSDFMYHAQIEPLNAVVSV